MKTSQPTITFAEFLDSLGEVQPQNTEHMQARARHIHNAALQIIHDGPFPMRVRESFPILNNAENKTDVELAVWWGRFHEWFEELAFPHWKMLSEARVVCR